MPKHTIRPLPIFKTLYPYKAIVTYFVDGGPIWTTSQMFYVETPTKHILVDAPPSVEQLRPLLPPKFEIEPIMSPEDALASVGLKPEEIDILILTHLHHDHALNINKFVNAEIYLQEDELSFAKSPHVFWTMTYSGVNVHTLMKMKLRLVKGDYQINDSIRIISTPGHTLGTQSVFVETSAGIAIIAGFCSIKENFEPPEPLKAHGIEVIPPGILVDFIKAYESTLKVKRYASIIIPCHENDLPKKIP